MKRLLMIGLPVVVLAAAGIGFFAFAHGNPGAKPTRPHVAENTAVVPLPSATINLSGDDGFQYLEVQVALVTRGPMNQEAMSKLVDDRKPALLDALTQVIEGQRFTAMRTPQGIQMLGATLETRFSDILKPVEVTHVYFEQFVAD